MMETIANMNADRKYLDEFINKEVAVDTTAPQTQINKQNEPLLDRNAYKRIKRYNKREMEEYLLFLHQSAFNDAVAVVIGILPNILAQVPELDKELADKIMEAIKNGPAVQQENKE